MAAITVIALVSVVFLGFQMKKTGDYSSGTIQIGVIVSDLEKSIDFYTNVLMMKKTGGFNVDSEFGKKSGLTGGEAFEVTILKTQDSEQASEWKLMSFGGKAKHPKQKYIQDDTGVQYVTLFVTSMKPFLESLKKHKVKILSETPTTVKEGRQFVLIQDPDGTFIELIGPE